MRDSGPARLSNRSLDVFSADTPPLPPSVSRLIQLCAETNNRLISKGVVALRLLQEHSSELFAKVSDETLKIDDFFR